VKFVNTTAIPSATNAYDGSGSRPCIVAIRKPL
jgi:hypothetical protein